MEKKDVEEIISYIKAIHINIIALVRVMEQVGNQIGALRKENMENLKNNGNHSIGDK